MRKLLSLAIAIGTAGFVASTLGLAYPQSLDHGHRRALHAFLSGAKEVPPVETDARGMAMLKANHKENKVFFVLVTRHLEEITQAHIHLGPKGQNGPIVALLFESIQHPVTRNGLLSMGILTEDDLTGPLDGEPLSALIQALRDGNAYVDVHTEAHPGGEIRGQIHPSGRDNH